MLFWVLVSPAFWKKKTIKLIQFLSKIKKTTIAIDIPSGPFCEHQPKESIAINADYTLSLELPKLAFFFEENAEFVGTWNILPIGLNQDFIQKQNSPMNYYNYQN